MPRTPTTSGVRRSTTPSIGGSPVGRRTTASPTAVAAVMPRSAVIAAQRRRGHPAAPTRPARPRGDRRSARGTRRGCRGRPGRRCAWPRTRPPSRRRAGTRSTRSAAPSCRPRGPPAGTPSRRSGRRGSAPRGTRSARPARTRRSATASRSAPIRIVDGAGVGVDLGRAHEPGAQARAGRDGVPDLLGGLVELQLVVVGELVRHRQPFSRSARDVVLGWTATTRR